MASLPNRIRIILSDRYTSIAVLALAIVARIIQLFFFYNMNVDGMYQVMAMQNFVEGHGITTSGVLAGDLSTVVYEPLIKWPPGYSLLLSVFYILCGHHYIIASLAFDSIAAIILIFACRAILRLLGTPVHLVNLFTLLTSFFIYSFYFINSSDAAAITFFTAGIYFMLRMIKKESYSLKSTLLMTTCLFLSGLIKYLFIPVVFIVPVFLFLKGFADRENPAKKTAFISFILLFVTLAAVLIWQKITGGAATYISEPSRGFYPENLLNAYPAIPASFIKPYSVSLLLPAGNFFIFFIFRVMQILHITFLVLAFAYLVKRIVKKGFKLLTATDSFFYTAFFLSAGISLVLVSLSLTVGKEENIPGHWWSYVEEPRYYGLITVLTHLGVFLLYQYYLAGRTRQVKYIFIAFLLLLLPETFRGIYFTAQRVIRVKEEEYIWQQEANIQAFAGLLMKKERRPGEKAVVTGSSYYINYRAGIYNHVPVLPDVRSISNPAGGLNTRQPVLLLVIIKEEDLAKPEYSRLQKENVLAGYLRGFYFYTLHVNPH